MRVPHTLGIELRWAAVALKQDRVAVGIALGRIARATAQGAQHYEAYEPLELRCPFGSPVLRDDLDQADDVRAGLVQGRYA